MTALSLGDLSFFVGIVYCCFKLMVPVPNNDVAKNMKGHRMHLAADVKFVKTFT